MKSFRTELEDLHNPVVEQEIVDLEKRIRQFHDGTIDETKFKSLRLARGVYGQRQQGVQMVRIKIPFGRLNYTQLCRIADISDEYSTGNLHLTTRQDIQIHYVSLDRTPELWAKLAEDDITLREACGNTVRNVTASPAAGIDINEPFDVTPCAQALFEYFLRNPICQDMGRKFKFAFSSSDEDTGLTFMHDLGFIPKLHIIDGVEKRGFKVMLGGGLGAQPIMAHIVNEFLPEDQLIPFSEAVIRTFDKYGERNNRNKARFKYLIQKEGLDQVLNWVSEEHLALKSKSFEIDRSHPVLVSEPIRKELPNYELNNKEAFEIWKQTNAIPQKQSGYFSVYIKVQTGDLHSSKARKLAEAFKDYLADELRVTQKQGLMIPFVYESALPYVYSVLASLDLAAAGFDSVADVTTCPGTDTCNLGISNSTEMARVLENVVQSEYPDLLFNRNLNIKISGCMNSCGHHAMADIGFHGSSLKWETHTVPAVQILLAGGVLGGGHGRAAERVIKVPTKRAPAALRLLLDDYKANRENENQLFRDYYDQKGKDYFYQLLKALGDKNNINQTDLLDWGKDEAYVQAIGVGECAGVVVDLVGTLLFEAEEKLQNAKETLGKMAWADSIYWSYNTFVNTAKAILLSKNIICNTQIGILKEFDKLADEDANFKIIDGSFKDYVLEYNRHEPNEAYANEFLQKSEAFFNTISVLSK